MTLLMTQYAEKWLLLAISCERIVSYLNSTGISRMTLQVTRLLAEMILRLTRISLNLRRRKSRYRIHLVKEDYGGGKQVNSYVNGTDVNAYIPDWRNLVSGSAEVRFGMVKATEGLSWANPRFRDNWDGMYAAGIKPRFAYHYGYPDMDPGKQAAYFTRYVRSYGLLQHDHFVLDLEVSRGRTPAEVTWWAWVFCTEVNRLASAHRCLVYTYPAFADAGNCAKLGSWYLWIADYGVPAPSVPGPWKDWAFWQYRPGQQQDMDLYHGDEASLLEFTSHSGPA